MRGLGFFTLLMALMAGPAWAADYGNVEVYDWSGVYGGAHAGFIWADVDVDRSGSDFVDTLGSGFKADFDGFIGGILGGVNFQAGNVVFGMDMDFGWSTAEGNTRRDLINYDHDVDWVSHFRGKVGFALDRVLFYGAGGLALADFNVTGSNELDDGGTTAGWSAGGGLEYALTDNILIRGEYLHDEYIDDNVQACDNIGNCANFNIGSSDNIVRLGVSFKFEGGLAF
jgi:outer membrane immunogenic protein